MLAIVGGASRFEGEVCGYQWPGEPAPEAGLAGIRRANSVNRAISA